MHRIKGLIGAGAALVCALMLSTTPSPAQTPTPTWPQRTVKFIVPLGPGAGVDIGSRLFAHRLSAKWGQPVVVENRPGGDGIVAISTFVNAHDDHVLLSSPTSSFTAHPYLHDNLPYKQSDLHPIARVSNTIITVSVPSTLPVSSLKELVALVRSQPGKLNWAGVTGALDFMFAGWLKSEGLDAPKVPYRNPVEAANDLAEGRVQIYEAAYAIVRPQVEAGKIKVLAVINTVRTPAAPQIPTAQEAGFPALTLDGLVGLFGPSELPPDVRERIAADVKAVSVDPIIKDRLTITGQVLNIGGPAEFAASIEAQRVKLAAAAKDLGIALKQ